MRYAAVSSPVRQREGLVKYTNRYMLIFKYSYKLRPQLSYIWLRSGADNSYRHWVMRPILSLPGCKKGVKGTREADTEQKRKVETKWRKLALPNLLNSIATLSRN